MQAIPGDNVRYCPIVLDLNGDGIKYKSWTSTGYNVHFDIDNDGFAEGMEWLDANDGFLARDLNGNGKIDNGAEMFGDNAGTSAYYKLAQYNTSVTAINAGKGNDVVNAHMTANDNAIDRIYPSSIVG